MNIAYIILLLFIVVGLLIISYMVYNHSVNKKKVDFIPNNEFEKKDKNKDDVLLFFYADWCPYSQKSKKIWNEILKDITFEGFGISYVSVNSDDKDKSSILNEYSIKDFPSIVLKKGDKKIIFDANLSKETLMNFLTTVYTS